MNKFFIQFLVFTAILSGLLAFQTAARAQPPDPLESFTQAIEGTGEFKTGLQKFEGQPHGGSSVEPGAEIVTTVIFKIIDFIKYILGTIAILYMIIGGLRIILEGKEEIYEKQKNNLKYIIYGLFVAIIADVLVTEVFFGEYGECIASATNAEACAKQGAKLFKGIANFIQMFVGSVTVLVIVLSGFKMVVSTGDEEAIKRSKKHIAIAVAGLILVAISEFIVEGIFFPEAGTRAIDVEKAQALLAQITNFAASFIVTLSIIFLIYGGYRYMASIGNEEQTGKAKKIIIAAIAGIIIALGAFGLVRTFLSIEKPQEGITTETLREFEVPKL